MRLNRNFVLLALLLAVAALGGGCGGINAGGNVSPASFLMPGLIKADPTPAVGAPTAQPAPARELAQVR